MKNNEKIVGADASVRPVPKEYKNNSGITLIALVVTIIVLLILAGVSLSLVAGSNGIIGKTVKAVNETNEKAVVEEVELVIAEANMEYYLDDTVTNETLAEYLAKKFSPYTTGSGAEITFNEDGNIQYEGKNGDLFSLTLGSNGKVAVTGKTEGTPGDTTVKTGTVTYNANGGTESVPSAQTAKEGSSVTVSFSPVPTRDGYTFLGWATSNNTTSAQYTQSGTTSFTMGTSNVTLYAVWADVLVGVDNYGDVADYSANGVTDWRVFLNDGSNIYLIASDYVPVSELNKASGISTSGSYCVYYPKTSQSGSTQDRDAFVSWLQTSSYWTSYASGIDGATATGGATLEQFWASYNEKYGTSYSAENQVLTSHEGYSNTLYFPHTSFWNSCSGYWLASGSSTANIDIMSVSSEGHVNVADYRYDTDYGVRPLVCLPAEIKTIKDVNGKWTFTK